MGVAIQYILVVNTNLTTVCVVVFIIGAYMMLFSLIRDIGSVIGSINERIKLKKKNSNTSCYTAVRIRKTSCGCDTVEFIKL